MATVMAPPPPPPPPQPQSHQQQQQSPSSVPTLWPRLGRCNALILLALIMITAVIVIIIWVAVQPRKLRYSIEHGSISGYNLTNDKLDANFHFVLRANNPNRVVSFYYDKMDVKVLYEDQTLSNNSVHPFYQPRRNVTHLDLDFAAKNVTIYGAVARDLKMERASGDVDLDVKITGKIRLKIGLLKMHRTLRALCGPLTVPFSSSKGFERVFCDVDMHD